MVVGLRSFSLSPSVYRLLQVRLRIHIAQHTYSPAHILMRTNIVYTCVFITNIVYTCVFICSYWL
jgi:hypothetical protein